MPVDVDPKMAEEAKPFRPSAPLPMAAHIPDCPTEDEAKAILATFDEMALLGDSSDVIAKREPGQPQSPEERLLLAVFGFAEEEWTFLVPSKASRAR
jgi:hypothetical protein